jgi:hypothetical protein
MRCRKTARRISITRFARRVNLFLRREKLISKGNTDFRPKKIKPNLKRISQRSMRPR